MSIQSLDTSAVTEAMVDMTTAAAVNTTGALAITREVNILGIVSIVVFYLVILGVGLWAARKSQFKPGQAAANGETGAQITESEDAILAGRNIGVFVGIFTMTATWVGGGYINGTAEMVYKPEHGLVWCLAPVGYALSLIFGGILFANRMRSMGYVTMLDPFQIKYGERMGGFLFLPALLGEVFWSAAILAALGATLSVIIGLPNEWAIIISTCIVLVYTFFGGLYSVAYTDVVQLICIFVGLWVCVPFSMLNEAVDPIMKNSSRWVGSVDVSRAGNYLDTALMLMFGGIPWQVYFQRILSCKTARKAQVLSFVAALGCFIMAIPAAMIGMVAASTNWSLTVYQGTSDPYLPLNEQKMVLPMVLQYLCPPVVSFVGLGAVSAAVMSSADSSILSAASMFARNIYRGIFVKHATEHHILIVMRVSIFIVGALATVMAIYIPSIYGLWITSSDLVYVILFPQLLCVVYLDCANTYGSIAAYLVGLLLRLSAGEQLIRLPALIAYPWFSKASPSDLTAVALQGNGTANSTHIVNVPYDEFEHYFPVKTFAMLLSLMSLVLVSFITDRGFKRCNWPQKWDFLHCVIKTPPTTAETQLQLQDKYGLADQAPKEHEAEGLLENNGKTD